MELVKNTLVDCILQPTQDEYSLFFVSWHHCLFFSLFLHKSQILLLNV